MSLPAIVFSSARALDGSDAASTNGARNIWVVSSDGTVVTPLTRDTEAQSGDAVWSPDGSMIAFDSDRSSVGPNPNLGFDIWTMKADGSSLTGLTDEGTVPIDSAGDPDWSPDGRKIALTVTCCGLDPMVEVGLRNADRSGGLDILTNVPTKFFLTNVLAGAFSARWSPSGSRLIFVSQGALDKSLNLNTNMTQNIWVMNSDGSGQAALTAVTATNADCFGPAWSPDGSKVAFVSARALDGTDSSNANNTSNIWALNADGTGLKPLTKLTAAGAGSTSPVWSPDGSKVAFESGRAFDGSDSPNNNATVNIWVMNSDGTGAASLTNLTAAGASSHGPAWSRDGSQLAFDSARAIGGSDMAGAASNIWVMNADGSRATPLTKNTARGADSHQPKWRP